VEDDIYSLELFHGPTLAFKDFGARFLAGVLGHFAKQSHEQITILVATSGDTGSAVAHGFYNLPGINVVVLYPSGKVSELQEKQFTTLGGNIVSLEIDGTFDDCQRMVKEAFADRDIQKRRTLSSANSINIARLLPQMFYYFRAVQQLSLNNNMPIIISVPSGNFGNLMAGLMAKRMGLPIDTFIAATNINDVVPAYLKTKLFTARPSVSTLSNAMDVGNPSNFVRVLDLYAQDWEAIRKDVVGYAFTDDETVRAIQDVHRKDGYTLDPHGAVGYLGLMKYRQQAEPCTGIFLETAHPGKFQEAVERALQSTIELPPALLQFVKRKKLSRAMKNDFVELKNYLLSGF
jgi:threonine synthase